MKFVKFFGDTLHTESVSNEVDWLRDSPRRSTPNMKPFGWSEKVRFQNVQCLESAAPPIFAGFAGKFIGAVSRFTPY
jgi:hypothetical protein